jgi:epoxyqueuosine reductase
MERALAAMSGIGWIGRNGCLFVPGAGSYVMLCEIICNLPLPAGHPSENPCRGCGACVAACPTGALGEDGLVDARKCISYHTIENRGPIPPLLWDKFSARLFGCDACQEACPHNRGFSDGRLATAKRIEDQPISLADVLGWAYDDWDIATRGRVLRRASREMFLRNAAISAGNSGDASLVDPLRRLEARADLAEVARWAIGRLETGKHKRRSLE